MIEVSLPSNYCLHALQVVNISSGLASIGNVKDGLNGHPVGTAIPPILTMELPYRCSKAALNMSEAAN